MNRIEHLLSILGEECNEVAQRVSKALRFGLKESQAGQDLDNAQRIRKELDHLLVAVEMLCEEGALSAYVDPNEMDRKRTAVEHYLKYSMECGTLIEVENP